MEKRLATTATEWGHSRWMALERCPREYEQRYVHPIGGVSYSGPAAIGVATHRGLAAHYLNSDVIKAINAGNELDVYKAEARRLVDGHIRFWSDREHFEVVDVERAVRVVIPGRSHDAIFTTRYDLVVKEDERLILFDHKTTSRDSGDFSREHQVSSQFLGSAAAWPYKQKGPVTVTLNRIIRTKVPSFDRYSFTITEREINRWKKDFLLLDGDRRRYERNSHYPQHRSSCQGRYGLCDFYNVCHGG